MNKIKDVLLIGDKTNLLMSLSKKIMDRIISYNEYEFSNQNFIYEFEHVNFCDTISIVADFSYNINKHFLGLFFLLDYLKKNKIKVNQILFPYLPYSRSNHLKKYQTFNLFTIIELLNFYDVTNIVTFDPHFEGQNFDFATAQIKYHSHEVIFYNEIEKIVINKNIDELVVIGPDEGSKKRVEQIAESFGVLGMFFNKIRKSHDEKVNYDFNINQYQYSEIKKKKEIIIVDDEICSGNTLKELIKFLKDISPNCKIYVFITHFFNNDLLDVFKLNYIKFICITNSIDCANTLNTPWIKVIDLSPFIIGYLDNKNYIK